MYSPAHINHLILFLVSIKWSTYFVALGAGAFVCHRCFCSSRILYSQFWPFFDRRRKLLPSPVSSPQINEDATEARDRSGIDVVDEIKVSDVDEENSSEDLSKVEENKENVNPKTDPAELCQDGVAEVNEKVTGVIECNREISSGTAPNTSQKESCSIASVNLTNLESSHEISHLIDNLVASKSFSLNNSSFGDGTVAKLNQLIHQVQDLRESVGEINAEFVNVRRGTYCAGAADISLFSLSSDSASPAKETEAAVKDSTHSPSLEWDSNGLHLLTDDSDSDTNAEDNVNDSVDDSTPSLNFTDSPVSSFRLTSDDSGNSSNSITDEYSLDNTQIENESKLDQSITGRKNESSFFLSSNNSFNFSSQSLRTSH